MKFTKRSMYKVHKWIAVTIGVFFLVWLISGIVMVLPPIFSEPTHQRTLQPLNFQEITVTPAEAVGSLVKILGESPQVNAMTLKRIADAVVYEIIVAGGGTYLIDARSGQLFTIAPEIVEQIARYHVQSQTNVLQIERVTHHNFDYQWGPLPAYQIIFDNDRSTAYYVSTRDGTVHRSNRWSRIRGAIESLHTLAPLKLITKQDAVRKGVLMLLSVVGIGAAVTGYYLALQRRRP